MSAIGTKRTCRIALHRSAFGGKADMAIASRLLVTQGGHQFEPFRYSRRLVSRYQSGSYGLNNNLPQHAWGWLLYLVLLRGLRC